MNLDPVALRWDGWGLGEPPMLLSFPPPSTCRTSVVSITSLPPNSPCVPDPYGPSSVFRALHYLIHDGHLISKKNQYSGSITQGLAMLHSRLPEPGTWTVLRAGGRAVGHAEHLDAQFTLDTFHMWKKSQVSSSSPTD